MNAVYYLTSGQADAKEQQTAQSQLKFWQLLYSCTKITFTRVQQQQFKSLLVAIVWHSHSKTDHCACNARTVPIWLMQAEPVACHPSLNQLDALCRAKHEPRWLSNDHITEGHRHKHVVWADSLWLPWRCLHRMLRKTSPKTDPRRTGTDNRGDSANVANKLCPSRNVWQQPFQRTSTIDEYLVIHQIKSSRGDWETSHY